MAGEVELLGLVLGHREKPVLQVGDFRPIAAGFRLSR